jgi:cytochrome c551/c552
MQDVTGGNPLTSDYTLATLVVHLQASTANGAAPFPFGTSGIRWVLVALALLFAIGAACVWTMPRRRLPIALGGTAAALMGVILALGQTRANAQSSPPQQTSATLDQMVAAQKSQREIARYVFDTQGCKSCHTYGQSGKLGFTTKGAQTGANFEGCIRLLTDVSNIVKVPESRRSGQQRAKTVRFGEFGCTFCHKVDPDKIGLTEVGAKLSHLHLGCVELEKQLAARSQQR